MATRIRLQRHGRKGYAFYHIVAADSRAPRDGKFIERLGSYNPNTNPATIDLNFERALYWIETGAQPSDTVRNILSKEGIMLMKHLNGGVRKGAFSAEEAAKKFEAWKQAKDANLTKKINELSTAAKATEKARQEAEVAANKAKAEIVAKKLAAKRAEEEAKLAEAAAAEAEAAPAEQAEAPATEAVAE